MFLQRNIKITVIAKNVTTSKIIIVVLTLECQPDKPSLANHVALVEIYHCHTEI